jgi:glutamine amidotransferase
MIGIVNYGMGNLRSVQKALQRADADARFLDQPDQIDRCDKLVLPGVGAFADAMATLRQLELVDPIRRFVRSGRPFLGICLGMQLLFDVSEEDGEHVGLGLIGGRVVRFNPTDRRLKVPHMGWNALSLAQADSPLYDGVDEGAYVYFVHSYHPQPDDEEVIAAWTDYDGPFCSSLAVDNVMATQFHPEKSQRVGLRMLANFAAL